MRFADCEDTNEGNRNAVPVSGFPVFVHVKLIKIFALCFMWSISEVTENLLRFLYTYLKFKKSLTWYQNNVTE